MKLSFYFFKQFLPPFVFGSVLFSFVLVLDKLFDLIDLILNKGVKLTTVGALLALFMPTVIPLSLPMGCLLGCMISFGRLSEENEITAVRASGISLPKAVWMIPLFALVVSFLMVPFNSAIAPWANTSFRRIFERIIQSDPLIKVEAGKFFSIQNIKILAESIDQKSGEMRNIFVYQTSKNGRPAERIFAQLGKIKTEEDNFKLTLEYGQLQRYDLEDSHKLIHTTFKTYVISHPLNMNLAKTATRFRNISSSKLKNLIQEFEQKGLKTSVMKAEHSLRYSIAFAPLALILVGIPLATTLRKGGKSFGIGISAVVIFIYYLILIFGLTLAEKGILMAHPALWIANTLCFGVSFILIRRILKK